MVTQSLVEPGEQRDLRGLAYLSRESLVEDVDLFIFLLSKLIT